MSFVDARRRQQHLASQRGRDKGQRREPGAAGRMHPTGEDQHSHQREQRVGRDAVDRQADHGDAQQQRGQLAPAGAAWRRIVSRCGHGVSL